jgi:2-polyprenyl-3-methyl-5-hydroxy-6-metoxy-1,4-benzoquinol methylase
MLRERSQEKELLDLGPEHYSAAEYSECLKNLFQINKLLGFYRDTVKILKTFYTKASILDIGCGGGLFLLHLSRRFPQMQMTGSEISPAAVQIAQQSLQSWQQKHSALQVSFEQQEQNELTLVPNSVDIILITLVCHHLKEAELVNFLKQAHTAAAQAVVINDLHRHWLAHMLYGLFCPLFFKNRLINHDGLISIRRGFIRQDWQRILAQAGLQNYRLKWCFPFRWQLVLLK